MVRASLPGYSSGHEPRNVPQYRRNLGGPSWWSRRESNPRPKLEFEALYMLNLGAAVIAGRLHHPVDDRAGTIKE